MALTGPLPVSIYSHGDSTAHTGKCLKTTHSVTHHSSTSQNSALRRARPAAVNVQTIGPCQKHNIQGFLEGIAVPFLPESFYFVESPHRAHPRTLREARTIMRRRPLPFAWPGWTGTVGTARRRPSRPRRPSREGLRSKSTKCLGFCAWV